ncbi:MAG: IMP cyclohydrolase, partial [Anaerovibrio sp.]|nr:IMP cyclohydrolase [Anaerovibrio sp.]
KYGTVVTNPSRYDQVADEIATNGCVSGMLRMELAQEAFKHTSEYDDCIQNYLMEQVNK